jgi:hypothetical protein
VADSRAVRIDRHIRNLGLSDPKRPASDRGEIASTKHSNNGRFKYGDLAAGVFHILPARTRGILPRRIAIS